MKMMLIQRYKIMCEHDGCDASVTVDVAAASNIAAFANAVGEVNDQWAYEDKDDKGVQLNTGKFKCPLHTKAALNPI